MTVEELAGKRYGGEFVFMFGHLEGRTRFVFECFDPRPDHDAFEYDGHTPNEAADRLKKYLKLPRRGMTFEQALERLKLGRKIKRIDWGKKYICMFDVNILMVDTGQKVASNWNPTEHDIMSNDWEIAG